MGRTVASTFKYVTTPFIFVKSLFLSFLSTLILPIFCRILSMRYPCYANRWFLKSTVRWSVLRSHSSLRPTSLSNRTMPRLIIGSIGMRLFTLFSTSTSMSFLFGTLQKSALTLDRLLTTFCSQAVVRDFTPEGFGQIR